MSFTALKNAKLSEKIDWLAYTQPISLEFDHPSYIDDHWKDIRPLPHYTKGQENKQGVRRYWNTENHTQGRYIILGGAALDTLQDNRLDVLQWANISGKKAKRIDFAIDITHSQFHPRMVQRRLRRGEAVTHALSNLTVFDEKAGGYTQYVGKKSAETYTRIYDKAAEENVNFPWVRVETVYQGDRAAIALKSYCEGASPGQLINRHVNFPAWNDWKTITSRHVAKLVYTTRETRTRAWLLASVSKTIAREINMDEDHAFWFQMIDAIKQELEILDPRKLDITW